MDVSSSAVDISELAQFVHHQALRVYRANATALLKEKLSGKNFEEKVDADEVYRKLIPMISMHLLKDDAAHPIEFKKAAVRTALGDVVSLIAGHEQAFGRIDKMENLYIARLSRLSEFHNQSPAYSLDVFEMVADYNQALYSSGIIKQYNFELELELQTQISNHIDELVARGAPVKDAISGWQQSLSRVTHPATHGLVAPLQQDTAKAAQPPHYSIADASTVTSLKKYATVFCNNIQALENQLAHWASDPSLLNPTPRKRSKSTYNK